MPVWGGRIDFQTFLPGNFRCREWLYLSDLVETRHLDCGKFTEREQMVSTYCTVCFGSGKEEHLYSTHAIDSFRLN